MYIAHYLVTCIGDQSAVIPKQLGSVRLLYIRTMYMSWWSGKQKLILYDNIIIVTTGHIMQEKNQVVTGIPTVPRICWQWHTVRCKFYISQFASDKKLMDYIFSKALFCAQFCVICAFPSILQILIYGSATNH